MPRIRLAILPAALLVIANLWADSPAALAWPATPSHGLSARLFAGGSESLEHLVAQTIRGRGDYSPSFRAVPDLASSLRSDLEDSHLDQFTLFQASLIAGGVQALPELQQRTRQFNQLCRSLSNELESIADPPSKLDLLLSRLHEWLLTGEYRAEYSELPRTLDDGHYNCVTATILFQALGEGCGMETLAIAAQSHVLCCVPGQTRYYVETTSRDWRTVAMNGCPQRTQELVRDGRELSPVELLGKVYYNMGVTQLEASRFARAAELFQTARQLDHQDQAARENLLATYNNWALAECDEGRFLAAKELLLRGLATDPNYPPLLANDLHIHQQWVKRLCNAGEFSTAVELLEQGYLRRPDAELFDLGRAAVYELWAKHQLDLLQAGL